MENHIKGLSAWQLTMMALGTVVGGSFFLGSAVAINAAGPSILISYILGGALVYFILFALSEMTVANPDSGSFRTFAAQAFGHGAGFVVGWLYWTGMVLAMSSEATAVSILIREWIPGISIPLLGGIIIIAVTLLNLLGADRLSKLESGLAAVKLLAIASFIVIGLLLIMGFLLKDTPIGAGELTREPLMPGGITSIAGSMLIVMFSYAGFEIIGLAASETDNPQETVPKAIRNTVLCLVGFYILSVAVLLPLIPTSILSEEISPMVAAMNRWGMGWAGAVLNFVLITAILSTMLAAMFGIGRMMRSLADEGLAPSLLKDEKNVPYRGILFSGFAMLAGLGMGFLLPRVYLFLISSGGFALLFTYVVIIATHIKFRREHGCPPEGKCQMPGYPYTSWIALFSIVLIIISMPFIEGQASGLVAGLIMTVFYILAFVAVTYVKPSKKGSEVKTPLKSRVIRSGYSTEYSKELDAAGTDQKKEKNLHEPGDPESSKHKSDDCNKK
ncbi:amino acid permease [Sinanaerobacter chloroacetimidivorans]|jgi:L-asparagine transporter-like permease|uniref:Amino acid permease n=1 Tax=Sinanaerobacter chloroacetimidivorans TaxID=2818044 RepID=A0A8J8B3J4_9FIRM|nr:amino acid permease [Sinanaerobacter chloroacetimidivorans]MBR0600399.1 amino acid permease [Sinanaerobacter chloroacetimidivorans]